MISSHGFPARRYYGVELTGRNKAGGQARSIEFDGRRLAETRSGKRQRGVG